MLIIAIDASYLELAVCRKWNIRIDYIAFITKIIKDVLGKESDNWRAYLYCNDPHSDNSDDFGRFVDYLSYLPHCVVRTGRKGKKTFACEYCKKDNEIEIQKTIDVSIVIDAIKLAEANLMEQFVLVAGDQDFTPLLEELQRRGIITAAVGVEGSQATELRCASDFAFVLKKKDFVKVKSQKKGK